jgi:hypothetical protein
MHTFFINDLIQLYCLRHVSNNHVFILRKTYMQNYGIFSCIRTSSLVDITMCFISEYLNVKAGGASSKS